MKQKLIIAITFFSLTICSIFLWNNIVIPQAKAEVIDSKYLASGTSGELLAKGISTLNDYGLYRIDDMGSGYHVYILTTKSGSQIHTVPIRKEK